jgi:hypothetical protein
MSNTLYRAIATLMLLSWSAGLAAAQAGRTTGNSVNNNEENSARVSSDPATREQPGAARLSRNFAAAGLRATDLLRDWQQHIAYTFQNGYPLSELSIGLDHDRAADALRLAQLEASSDADRAALEQLHNLFESLQRWSDELIEDKKNLRLAPYYMSPAELNDDAQFKKNAECAGFLARMLASGRLAEGATCH